MVLKNAQLVRESMVLKNAQLVRQMWKKLCKDSRLALIAIRHANKADNTPRCGLSERGVEQCYLLMVAIQSAMQKLMFDGRIHYFASRTDRNIKTLALITPPHCPDPRLLTATPRALDIPFLGPNDEDSATCTQLVETLGISRNEAFPMNWEEHGFQRLGETPAASRARVRAGLEEAVRNAGERVVIYCGNSPVMDGALGQKGVMAELEALFLAYHNGEFQLLGRVAPEFSD